MKIYIRSNLNEFILSENYSKFYLGLYLYKTQKKR